MTTSTGALRTTGRPWAGPATALLGGLAAAALTLPEPRRPSLVVAGLGLTALVAGLLTAWRVLGGAAVLLLTAAPLVAGALEPAAARPLRLTAAAAAALVLVVGLDMSERIARRGPSPGAMSVRVVAEDPLHRFGLPALALVGAAAVAVTGTADAAPSAALVLLGLVTAVGALVVGVMLHRGPRRRRLPDIQ